MYDYGKLVLGLAPTRRRMYDAKWAYQNRDEIRKRVTELCGDTVEIVDIDWLNEEGIIIDPADAKKVADYFKSKNVDALFMPHCNFGSEEPVGMLGKLMQVPFLLWGPRDVAPPMSNGVDGVVPRQTDVQCGMFASSKSLARYGVPFTYIENCPTNSDIFANEFNDFLRVANVVRAWRNMRVLWVGNRPKPFLSMMINESQLLEKFGIELVPVTPLDVVERCKKYIAEQPGKVKELVDSIKGDLAIGGLEAEDMNNIAGMTLAYLELCEEHNAIAIASECWPAFRFIKIPQCYIFGEVANQGIPVGCETDIHGVIAGALLAAAARGTTAAFCADLTVRHPTNDNAELLWHCGPFARQLMKKDFPNPALVNWRGQYEIAHGDLTIARFDQIGGNYKLFADDMRGVDGPVTNGNYIWAECDDWVAWEKKFMYGPYVHHVAGVHGKFGAILHEATKYMGDVEADWGTK